MDELTAMFDQGLWHRIVALTIATLATIAIGCTGELTGFQGCPSGEVYDEDGDRCVPDGDADAGAPADTDPGDLDTGPGEPDTGSDEPDTGSDEPDTGSNEPDTDELDTGPDEPDTGSDEPDTGSDEPDTGPDEPDVDPGDLSECGEDVWDDTHDGTDPWEQPLIDCDYLNASWDCNTAQIEQEVLDLVNEKRSQNQTCGSTSYPAVGPVEMNELLQCASRIHSWDMIGRGYTGHDTPEGVTFSQRIALVGGGTWGYLGENINYGSGTASGIVSSWMNSAGHCANIMNGSYNTIGVGLYNGYATMKMSYETN